MKGFTTILRFYYFLRGKASSKTENPSHLKSSKQNRRELFNKLQFLNKTGFFIIFIIFAFAKPAVSQFKSTDSLKKPTICTVTINSSEEKEVFQSHLGEDFNFVELTDFATRSVLDTGYGNIPQGPEIYNDWFLRACQKGVECDILVISGHFGGSFFGSSGLHLGLTELQSRSCQQACDGILKKPKEVFLFGCNTTAGKDQDWYELK